MSTTLTKPEGVSQPPVPELLVEVFLDQIEPSPFNRKKFNEKALEELAASIVLTDGVIEPVILRRTNGSKASYQLVAGERRWLSSKLAVEKMGFQRKTIKSIVKSLTDAQAIELTLIENAQREDVHPLELCKTYKALMGEKDSTTGKPYTRELIAERVKKSYSLVCNILQADQLAPEIQKACLDGKISGSIALEICKYQPADQEHIFLQCFPKTTTNYWDDPLEFDSAKKVVKDKNAEASISVRRLRSWIANHIHIDLTKAPFDTKDGTLLKGATSCVNCPKRTGSNPGLFAEAQDVVKGDVCTDSSCYSAKKDAFVQIRISQAEKESAKAAPAPATVGTATTMPGGFSQPASAKADKKDSKHTVPGIQKIGILEYSDDDDDNNGDEEKAEKKGVLYDFTLATAKCKLTQKAIYADGPDLGKFADICVEENCKNHGGYSGSSSGRSTSHKPKVTFERRVQIWNQRVQLVHRDSLAKEIVEKKPLQWGEEETQMVAQRLIALTGYQDQNKLRRILGLGTESEFGQSKLKNHAKKLKGAELLRFILIVALAPEFGLDDQYFGGNLKSSDPLAVVAGNYNVDADKHLADAKAGLEEKRPKTDAEKAAIAKAKEKEWADVEKSVKNRVAKPIVDKPAKPAKTAAKTKSAPPSKKKAAKKKSKK